MTASEKRVSAAAVVVAVIRLVVAGLVTSSMRSLAVGRHSVAVKAQLALPVVKI
jgi:hypothetical protein